MNAWLSVAVFVGSGTFAAGVDAYRAARFDEARIAFGTAIAEEGDDAPAAWHYDLALAALRSGALTEAETAADAAHRAGGADFAGLAEFVRGNVAFARCEQSLVQAAGPEAESFAFDVAIALATKARDSWLRAEGTRAEWPEARRNVDRALRKLEELAQLKAAAEARQRDTKRERVPDPPATNPDERKAAPEPKGVVAELSPDRVRALLDVVAAKEQRKRAERKASRVARAGAVERDW